MSDTDCTCLHCIAGTPTIPDNITVNLAEQRLYVDGRQFPFHIAEEPKAATFDPESNEIPSVLVRIYADTVEVIEPDDPADALR